jgi:uncharacterized protein
MATNTATTDHALNNKELDNAASADSTGINGQDGAAAQRTYGGNPLAHLNTGESARFGAFGGEFQPGLYRPTTHRKFANPAPLGLSAFALTTFVLSLINVQTRGVTEPNIIVGLAFAYGGLIQLLAGMWYVSPLIQFASIQFHSACPWRMLTTT